jgi:hypothetical protein
VLYARVRRVLVLAAVVLAAVGCSSSSAATKVGGHPDLSYTCNNWRHKPHNAETAEIWLEMCSDQSPHYVATTDQLCSGAYAQPYDGKWTYASYQDCLEHVRH